jgi:PHD/YefM family antitoxin component YafN of YafNO toxin-antitoxin module
MITVKMTETEYEAYQLYLKSIELMQTVRKRSNQNSSLEEYLANPENRKEIEAGLDDIKEGRITWIDPENLWANIK